MLKKTTLLKFINFWPPFLGAGIKVEYISKDYKEIKVSLKMRFWNKNIVGTHFGGSLYAMTDPFYMLMIMQILGKDYIVWDKASKINFKRPGKGKVTAHFTLNDEQINHFKNEADSNYKYEPILNVSVTDELNNLVADVEKVLYIRRKDKVKSHNH